MELIHSLQKAGGTKTIISEPIGFDKMKTTISRGDYHGMSAEVSVGTLEFYCQESMAIIQEAYETDIDTEVTYRVETEDGAEIFEGTLDLSTYAAHSGDYCSISCKVGEVGVKTKFNNRTSTEVDLNGSTDVDGNSLSHSYTWIKTKIPARDIVYKNEYQAGQNTIWDQSTAQAGEREAYRLVGGKEYQWINVPIELQPTLNEFGSCEPNAYIPDIGTSSRNEDDILNNNGEYCGMLFSKGTDFDEKYGSGSTYSIIGSLTIKLEALDELFNNIAAPSICGNRDRKFAVALMLMNGETTMKDAVFNSGGIAWSNWQWFNDGADGNTRLHSATFTLNINQTGRTDQALYLGFIMSGYNIYDDCATWHEAFNEEARMKVTVMEGSYLKLTLDSQQPASPYDAELIPVHEALCKTAEMISGLTVKSDYYGRFDSSVNPTQTPGTYAADSAKFMASFGPGALKALTNGYKIRDLFTDGDEERNMVVSFKKLIESLDAQDCIGWGFETDENGQVYIRVEPWAWFYKDDVLLQITNPTTKDRSVNTKAIISELTIGYKKYTTNEDLNSVDSIHSERTFTGGITAVAGKKSKLCEFVADNYAIELTRRQGLKKTTEEYKYDETNFVLELTATRSKSSTRATYAITSSWKSGGSTLSKPSQLLNAILSPRRMAERWRAFLFQTNTQAGMTLTSGTINYKAMYATKQWEDTGSAVTFRLTDPIQRYWPGTSISTREDATITKNRCKLKAETLKVEYPVTLAQYQTILANPMGIIEVDGEKCWIRKFTYDFNEGTAEFELIPKYE